MTDSNWERLLSLIAGSYKGPTPVGHLADAPWFSAFAGASLHDYFFDDEVWFEANRTAYEQFSDTFFFAGWWAEFGMISNPPAFGARCIWPETGCPSCERIIESLEQVGRIPTPNVRSDGLLPLILGRMARNRQRVEALGHRYRFAIAHGPLTIASYLVGHTEFMLGIRLHPEATAELLDKMTDFVIDWLGIQRERFPSIDGVLILEDFIGFLGEDDFRSVALPQLKRIFTAHDVAVRFLHNDSFGLITGRFLSDMNVNLFNFGPDHTFEEIRGLAGPEPVLIGGIPPRDVLGARSPDEVREWTSSSLSYAVRNAPIIIGASGFLPPACGIETLEAVREVAATC